MLKFKIDLIKESFLGFQLKLGFNENGLRKWHIAHGPERGAALKVKIVCLEKWTQIVQNYDH